MAKTRAQQNKAIRQEALREQLANQGHVQHIIEICGELNELDNEFDALQVQRKKIVMDTKLKLINKYLPDLRTTEINAEVSGPNGKPIEWIITPVEPLDESQSED